MVQACNHSACFPCWLPPSDLFLQQAQNGSRLISVNLQTACSRRMNVWRYSHGREQELKAQYLFYLFISSFLNGNALSVVNCAARFRAADFLVLTLWDDAL